MAFLTRNQLIDALGGEAETAQLIPDRTTGGIKYTALDEAIADASGDIEADVGTRYKSLEANPPRKLQRIAKQLGVYYVWGQLKNKVMPETVRQMYGSAKQDLKDIANTDSQPGEGAELRFPSYVDNSDGNRRCVYDVMKYGGILGRR